MAQLETAPDAERFEVRITADSHLSWLRTRLSLENTMMSARRTGISLIAFGFTIVQFFERLRQMSGASPAAYPMPPQYLGLSLIGYGVFAVIFSIWWYWEAQA